MAKDQKVKPVTPQMSAAALKKLAKQMGFDITKVKSKGMMRGGAAKKMMRGGAATAKKKPSMMRGGGMAKAKKMMRGGKVKK
tara:strand:- start:872 stop:1117 length:246 start_codon:yes stop_codon:yes gene_type:complete